MNTPRKGLGLGDALRSRGQRALAESVIERARIDSAAWRHLRTLLVTWAREDEAMRRELVGELAALGAGRRGNAAAATWANGMLVGLVKVWTSQGPDRITVCDALLRAASMFPGLYPSDFPSLRNRYYRVRNDPEVRRIAGLK
jgi:hypothetical protein